jgi:hypothetical protein
LALLDSGATDNFISPSVVDHFQIPSYELSKPRTIRNVDRTKNSIGAVTHAVNLEILYNGKKQNHNFFIIDLGTDHMLLGMPFFAATNPSIDWTAGTFNGKVIASTPDSHQWTPN